MDDPISFLPGHTPTGAALLSRYLPPIPVGVTASWLEGRAPPGAWVLDPFGASPRTAVEAARLGYRVLVAANNPISRFLLELAANPPNRDELRAALAELATARKGIERLEPHIRSLYVTQCNGCGQEVQVEAFLWDRGAAAPYARIYHCPNCGLGGEQPAVESDAARAAEFATGGLHRARALERVAAKNDPDRGHVEEALEVYLPRAVYALFTLINKLDGLTITARRRFCLEALLLYACDAANTMWPYPAGRARPRQLTIPPRFRENNVWLALEEAVDRLAQQPDASGGPLPGVPLRVWPDQLPSTGGLCIFEGRLKDLGEQVSKSRAYLIDTRAVIAALPRPNQAFWTLSALWAGWLWGPEAVGPFKSVLRRRRYDWAWHSTALHAALENLAPLLGMDIPMLGLIGEAEPAFLATALVAADSAGYDLEGLALRAGSGQVQITWKRGQVQKADEKQAGSPAAEAESIAVAAAQDLLRRRGEPASYLVIQAAAILALAQNNRLTYRQPGEQAASATSAASPAEALTQLNNLLEEAFSYRSGFLRYGGSGKSLEAGQWWLRGAERDSGPLHHLEPPLADRVEMELVRQLIKGPGRSALELDRAVCQAFPGLLTPGRELVEICLESYAVEDSSASGGWRLRPEDAPRERRKDLVSMASLLRNIASHLGFTTENRNPMIWRNAAGEIQYVCYIIASAILGEIVFGADRARTEIEIPAGRGLIVLPGGRANLAAYKLAADPRLAQAVEASWRFVKFRQLRWLAENPALNVQGLSEQIALDSLSYNAPQLRLF